MAPAAEASPFGQPFAAPSDAPAPVTATAPAYGAFETPTMDASPFAAPQPDSVPAPQWGGRAGDAQEPDPSGQRTHPVFATSPAMTRPTTEASALDFENFQLRERSAIASEALSELSRLSGYRPAAVENRGQESMPRRTPQATPGLQTPPETSTVPHRERSATDVRSMLSGFRAGVERGRADQPKD
jgi:hypothetical protein